jgi:hypothetical protein
MWNGQFVLVGTKWSLHSSMFRGFEVVRWFESCLIYITQSLRWCVGLREINSNIEFWCEMSSRDDNVWACFLLSTFKGWKLLTRANTCGEIKCGPWTSERFRTHDHHEILGCQSTTSPSSKHTPTETFVPYDEIRSRYIKRKGGRMYYFKFSLNKSAHRNPMPAHSTMSILIKE